MRLLIMYHNSPMFKVCWFFSQLLLVHQRLSVAVCSQSADCIMNPSLSIFSHFHLLMRVYTQWSHALAEYTHSANIVNVQRLLKLFYSGHLGWLAEIRKRVFCLIFEIFYDNFTRDSLFSRCYTAGWCSVQARWQTGKTNAGIIRFIVIVKR